MVAPYYGNPYVLVEDGGEATAGFPWPEADSGCAGLCTLTPAASGRCTVGRPPLTTTVQDAVDPLRFDPRADNLDLYGGVGLLAAALADAHRRDRSGWPQR